eukprot:TRINITY_DN3173_c0_g1_i4.p1 TRINITY_DN3173_c0_g1~~TRINITY_DN3173_c0_g1_i4.p1  ORF type:complete len:533 (-),score=48.83 TRINITY_DN3173_c0_g1_i4:350-1948(-)
MIKRSRTETETEGEGEYELIPGLPVVNDLDIARVAAESSLQFVSNLQVQTQTSGSDADESGSSPSTMSTSSSSLHQSTSSEDLEVSSTQKDVGVLFHIENSTKEEDEHVLLKLQYYEPQCNGEESDDEFIRAPSISSEDMEMAANWFESLNVTVEDDDKMKAMGAIHAIIEATVVVQGQANCPAFEEGSVVCTSERCVIGSVSELFGPVSKPLYAVKRACTEEIFKQLVVGQRVFTVNRLSNYVILQDLEKETRQVKDDDLYGEDQISDEEELMKLDCQQQESLKKPKTEQNAKTKPRKRSVRRFQRKQPEQQVNSPQGFQSKNLVPNSNGSRIQAQQMLPPQNVGRPFYNPQINYQQSFYKQGQKEVLPQNPFEFADFRHQIVQQQQQHQQPQNFQITPNFGQHQDQQSVQSQAINTPTFPAPPMHIQRPPIQSPMQQFVPQYPQPPRPPPAPAPPYPPPWLPPSTQMRPQPQQFGMTPWHPNFEAQQQQLHTQQFQQQQQQQQVAQRQFSGYLNNQGNQGNFGQIWPRQF